MNKYSIQALLVMMIIFLGGCLGSSPSPHPLLERDFLAMSDAELLEYHALLDAEIKRLQAPKGSTSVGFGLGAGSSGSSVGVGVGVTQWQRGGDASVELQKRHEAVRRELLARGQPLP